MSIFVALLAIALVPTSVAHADDNDTHHRSVGSYCPYAARNQTGPPTPGEQAFINLVRGHVPGSDTQLLNTGRTVCNELAGGTSARYVDGRVAAYLGITATPRFSAASNAEQIVVAAVEYICPGVPESP